MDAPIMNRQAPATIMISRSLFPRIHLDVNLQTGVNGHNSGNGIKQVEYIQQVLYFTCNCIDNQIYTKQRKGKCSQNDTRIVLPMDVENGCIQLPQNWVKLRIEAHYPTELILTV